MSKLAQTDDVSHDVVYVRNYAMQTSYKRADCLRRCSLQCGKLY